MAGKHQPKKSNTSTTAPIFSKRGTSQQDPEQSLSPSSPTEGLIDPTVQAAISNLAQDIKMTFQQELRKAVSEFKAELTSLGNRTDTLESKTDELCRAQGSYQRELSTMRSEIDSLKEKQEDLENRSRRNNLRIRNIPESVSGASLPGFLQGFFHHLLPDASQSDLLLDRAHRALRARPSSDQRPRDVIVRFHYFRTKEKILTATRNLDDVNYHGSSLQLFQDLAPMTIQ